MRGRSIQEKQLAVHDLDRRAFITGGAVLILVALLYLWQHCFVVRTEHLDQGLMPLGADLIARGKLIYRDFFTIHLPGSFLWLALFFKLFGATWFVCRSVALGTILCITFCILVISRQVIRSWLVFLPAALFVVDAAPWACNFHYWDALLLVSASAILLIKLIEGSGTPGILAVSAGLSGGMAIACSQVVAPAVVGAFVTTAAVVATRFGSPRRGLSIFGCCLLGAGAVFASVLAYLIATGTLQDCLDCTVGFVLNHYSGVNQVPYGFGSFIFETVTIPASPQLSLYSLMRIALGILAWLPVEIVKDSPFLVALGVILYFTSQSGSLRRSLSDHPKATLLTVLGYLCWLTHLHRPDVGRLFWGSQFLMIMLFYFAERALKNLSWSRLAVKLSLGMIMVAALTLAIIHSVSFVGPKMLLSTRRGNVVTQSDLRIVGALTELTAPYEKVLVYPYDELVSFLGMTSLPGDLPFIQYRYNTGEQIEEVIADMERNKVRYAVRDLALGNDSFADGPFPSYAPVPSRELLIEPYLSSKFRILKSYGRYLLMERKGQ